MLEFIAASENLPFTVAIAVMLIIAVLEGITTILGAGISSVLETLLPDIDMDVDLDASGSQHATPMIRFLGWLRVGQVPFLMLLVIFLTAFGLIGLGVQSLSTSVLTMLLPAGIATLPALVLSIPAVRMLGGLLNKVMPKDETEAVSGETFVGRVATLTLGSASKGNPAQAKLRDEHGHTHYVMVEPDEDSETFSQNDAVLLVKKQGVVFSAIRNEHAALTDT